MRSLLVIILTCMLQTGCRSGRPVTLGIDELSTIAEECLVADRDGVHWSFLYCGSDASYDYFSMRVDGTDKKIFRIKHYEYLEVARFTGTEDMRRGVDCTFDLVRARGPPPVGVKADRDALGILKRNRAPN